MGSPKEREFLTDLKHSMREQGVWFHKIADMPHFAGSGARFDAAKPFDGIALWKGIPVAIEAKSLPEYRAFGLRDLRPNQIEGLDAFARAGGASYVLLHIQGSRGALPKMLWFNWGIWKPIWTKHSTGKAELGGREAITAERVVLPPAKPGGKPRRDLRYPLQPWLDEIEWSPRQAFYPARERLSPVASSGSSSGASSPGSPA